MVLFFSSNALGEGKPAVTLYMGRDKVENEDLIRYAFPEDVWLHVDKLSSAHVYIRLPKEMDWTKIPEPLLVDAAQLVKANSIQGNKLNDQTIIYTPASNLKKTGDMAVGAVSFKNDRLVRRVHVPERLNAVVNRLNKTKIERQVDHEAERIQRQKEEAQAKRLIANAKRNAELEEARQRKADREARSYANLDKPAPASRGLSFEEEEEEWHRSHDKVDDFDPNEDFM